MGIHPDDMPILSYGDSLPADGVCRHLDKFNLGVCKRWPDDFVSRQLTESGWWGEVGDNATYEDLRGRITRSSYGGYVRNGFYYWSLNQCNAQEPEFGKKGTMFRASFVDFPDIILGHPHCYWVYTSEPVVILVTFHANLPGPGNISFKCTDRYLGGNVSSGAGTWPEGPGVPYTISSLTCPHNHTFSSGVAYSAVQGDFMAGGESHIFPDELWPRLSMLVGPHLCFYNIIYDGSQAWAGNFPLSPMDITFGSPRYHIFSQTQESAQAGEPPGFSIIFPALWAAGKAVKMTACEVESLLLGAGRDISEEIQEDCQFEQEGETCP